MVQIGISRWYSVQLPFHEVGKALNKPTTGLLKSNLPAFMLNKIISAEGTITLTTVL